MATATRNGVSGVTGGEVNKHKQNAITAASCCSVMCVFAYVFIEHTFRYAGVRLKVLCLMSMLNEADDDRHDDDDDNDDTAS